MREIKFRGFWEDKNGKLCCKIGNLNIVNNKEHTGYYISNDYGAPFAYKVIPESVGQYTGLKDKNGKEIYEGDIVEYVYTGEDGDKGDYKVKKGVMNFKKNGWHINSRWLDGFTMRMFQFEVIGNIYDKE